MMNKQGQMGGWASDIWHTVVGMTPSGAASLDAERQAAAYKQQVAAEQALAAQQAAALEQQIRLDEQRGARTMKMAAIGGGVLLAIVGLAVWAKKS
jgi:hypothetical protein